ncbi:MAG: DUF1570 domain-containing protein [Planctomycetes bacterium]|nr:DUF1570 domain-containing protein [Planctomycetota bacterium]
MSNVRGGAMSIPLAGGTSHNTSMDRPYHCLLIAVLCLVFAAETRADPPRNPAGESTAAPLERFRWRPAEGPERDVLGKVLTEAEDGGLLVIGQDGRLWTIDKPQLAARDSTGETFTPLTSAALGKQLKTELGAGFDVLTTRHYVICTSARRKYAQWCGALFERLYTSFHNHWKQRGMKLAEPEFPLIALVFASEKEFARFATQDAGADAATAKGYFSIATNRMVLYDLTAADASPIGDADIDKQVAAIPYNIATIVHEATHQIAFNSGLHTRFADNPLWLVEGMAMYFETPDLSNKSGWKTAGAVNTERLGQFRDFLSSGRRRPDSLKTLIMSDARFNDSEQSADAYAEAWVLSYFLIRTKKEAYVKYLNTLAAKPPLVADSPEERFAEFRAAFGDDLNQLERAMLKSLGKLK